MKSKILFVDDDANILAAFERHLHRKYDLVTQSNPMLALEIIKKEGPFAAVVSDYRMPEMNGIQFLSQVNRLAPDTVRIMLTGQADMQAAIDGINEGHLFRFLVKPCLTETIIQTVNDAVRQYFLLTSERELLEKTLNGTIKLLTEILSVVRPNAFSRSLRVAGVAKRLAEHLKVPDLWEVEVAARISQIGCVTIPQDVLDRYWNGGKLSDAEQQMMIEHAEQGQRMIGHIPRMEKIAEAIAYQDKSYDGSGLPKNDIKGDEIPLIARLLKVAIDFDRVQANGATESEAVQILLQHASHYDSEILSSLHVLIGGEQRGPIETIINVKELQSGMVLAADIRTTSGQILVPKGVELCELNKMLLTNIDLRGNLQKPVQVFRQM